MPTGGSRQCRRAAAVAAKVQCKFACCAISDEVRERIRASVEEGRGRSMFDNPTPEMNRMHGVQCRCGVPRKPPGISKHVDDDGLCFVHPEQPPQQWTRGAGHGDSGGS